MFEMHTEILPQKAMLKKEKKKKRKRNLGSIQAIEYILCLVLSSEFSEGDLPHRKGIEGNTQNLLL